MSNLEGRELAGDSPGTEAYLIISGSDDLATKRAELERLAAQHPDDAQVYGYFESLAMQEALEETPGHGKGTDEFPENTHYDVPIPADDATAETAEWAITVDQDDD